jgi:hypothetical protein
LPDAEASNAGATDCGAAGSTIHRVKPRQEAAAVKAKRMTVTIAAGGIAADEARMKLA